MDVREGITIKAKTSLTFFKATRSKEGHCGCPRRHGDGLDLVGEMESNGERDCVLQSPSPECAGELEAGSEEERRIKDNTLIIGTSGQ